MILVIQNDPIVPLASFERLLQERSVSWQIWRAYLDAPPPAVATFHGIVVLGGTMSVFDEATHPFLRQVKQLLRTALQLRIPLFGICLGGQLLAEVSGGTVTTNRNGERGLQPVRLTAAAAVDPLFAGLPKSFAVFQWHHDSFEPPADALYLASSERCPFQAFRIGSAWGVQFHPEVDAATVALWSAGEDGGTELLAEFAAASDLYLQLSARLLGNFLKVVAGDNGFRAASA